MYEGELDSGLLGIGLSDSGDEALNDAPKSREEKNAQSEDEFQRVRREFRPKIENGEIFKVVKFPLSEMVSKAEAQELLHAVEELYFFRRYDDAMEFVQLIFSETGRPAGLDDETKELLRYYETRCHQKKEKS
ncbi:hypothetical protein VTK73DRAFT_9711 [Phialemonium thermophilum]|uniref:Uncharacterized protein n=1 Tax=Phialemonium thermophilum TaxID=223376 RepID=A0ABR3XIZ6_9PEZI